MKKISPVILTLPMVMTLGCLDISKKASLEEEAGKVAQEKSELRAEVKKVGDELRRREKLASQYQELQKKEATMKIEAEEIQIYANQLQAAQEFASKALPAWKQAATRSLGGLQLGNVTLLSGKTLIAAEVAEVGDEVVKFKQGQVVVDVPMADLPENIRLALLHEPSILAKSKMAY